MQINNITFDMHVQPKIMRLLIYLKYIYYNRLTIRQPKLYPCLKSSPRPNPRRHYSQHGKKTLRPILEYVSINSYLLHPANIKKTTNNTKHSTTHCNWLHTWHQHLHEKNNDTTTRHTPETWRITNQTKIIKTNLLKKALKS